MPHAALRLDRVLGDPLVETGPFGFRSALRLDEREEFPDEAASVLDDLGVNRGYVPAALGGTLHSFEDLALTLRAIARRDVTLAVGHGKTVLGSLPALMMGDLDLQGRVARQVLAREAVALALTERDNGSDLLSSRVRAERGTAGLLRGEKWLINNATRATALSVFARTRDAGGPRGFSLFFVDKREIGATYTLLPKIRTHGIRGADISGIRFDASPCAWPPIGGEGAGLSVILKTFAVTRTLIANVAVGALDSALRIALRFARSRALYGGTVLAIPHARATVCDAAAVLLACEAASLAGARILHVAPEQAGFWSSALKYAVPTLVERAIGELAVVLGARHYLREGEAHGMFQKILRDVAILSLFDGNTLVNLNGVALHANVPPLEPGAVASSGSSSAGLLRPLHLLEEVSALEPRRLAIFCRRISGAEDLAAQARACLEARGHDGSLSTMVERLEETARAVRGRLARMVPRGPFDMTAELVGLAGSYARLATAALAANAFATTPWPAASVMGSGNWLTLFLARELGEPGCPVAEMDSCRTGLLDCLLGALDRADPFSLFASHTDGGRDAE